MDNNFYNTWMTWWFAWCLPRQYMQNAEEFPEQLAQNMLHSFLGMSEWSAQGAKNLVSSIVSSQAGASLCTFSVSWGFCTIIAMGIADNDEVGNLGEN